MQRSQWIDAPEHWKLLADGEPPRADVSNYRRRPEADRSLHRLTRELVAARQRAGLRQADVAWRMRTTKSAISRLERGLLHRPTLTTIENYALVVGCIIEIHLAPWP